MINISAEEREKLNKKLEVYHEFEKEFPKCINPYSIQNAFSINELLDKRVRDLLIQADIGLSSLGQKYYRTFILVYCKLNYEEKKQFLVDLKDYKISSFKSLLAIWNDISELETKSNPDMNSAKADLYAMELMNDSGLFKYYLRGDVNNFIIDAAQRFSPDDDGRFIDLLDKIAGDFYYKPVLISNVNISKEDKIDILKKFYKQKDLGKYINYFRKIKDLGIIDSFIDATIIQNNHVKEKDTGIIRFFQKMFIDPKATDIDINMQNFESFTSKYRKYFMDNDGFAQKFLQYSVLQYSTNEYTRQNKYRNFICAMFALAKKDEYLQAIKQDAAFKPLLVSIGNRFITSEYDDDYLKVLSELDAEYYKDDLRGFVNYISTNNVSKYSMMTFEQNLFTICKNGYLRNMLTCYNIDFINGGRAIYDRTCTLFKFILKDQNIELLEAIKLFNSPLNYLGLNVNVVKENCKSRWARVVFVNSLYELSSKYIRNMMYAIDNFFDNTEDIHIEFVEALKKKLFESFELNGSTEIFNNIMEVKEMVSNTSYSDKADDYINFVLDMLNVVFPRTIGKVYNFIGEADKYQNIVDEFNNVKNSINLYMNIN